MIIAKSNNNFGNCNGNVCDIFIFLTELFLSLSNLQMLVEKIEKKLKIYNK